LSCVQVSVIRSSLGDSDRLCRRTQSYDSVGEPLYGEDYYEYDDHEYDNYDDYDDDYDDYQYFGEDRIYD
jgi:hypothetical protein